MLSQTRKLEITTTSNESEAFFLKQINQKT